MSQISLLTCFLLVVLPNPLIALCHSSLLTMCTIGSCSKEQLAAIEYVSGYAVGDLDFLESAVGKYLSASVIL